MTYMSYTGCYDLVEYFGTKDFAILGFPCAQFMNQEPGHNEEEILNCLKYVNPADGYEPNFLLFQKSTVNGELDTINPIFRWLKSGCGLPTTTIGLTSMISWTPVMYNDIEWNFGKFLVSKSGRLVRRYTPETLPQFLMEDIANLIKAPN
ncbi:hypothetical protein SAMD00019534_086300, partial [Acytostelium subglobosum LB1]|uniref:hypothetical protein n=1 Tax=Acytostelium subglobosum LB1 TaxID=1410327 RepID=UPI000644D6CE